MSLISDCKSIRALHWKEGATWLPFTVIGGLVPFWGSVLLILLFDKWKGFGIFFQRGEFIIYSAPFLAFTLYTFFKERKSPSFKKSLRWFAAFSIIGVLVAMTLFAGVTSKYLVPNMNITINFGFLCNFSLCLYLSSVSIAFLTFVFDSSRAFPDVEELRTKEMGDLANNFDAIIRGEND